MNSRPQQFSDSVPTVLVIDDSMDVHRLLRARLRHEEIELMSAEDGKSGIQTAKTSLPAMILLDPRHAGHGWL
jgi:response regulator RpfG family c-di-GMP phosphodiesterase